MQKDNIYAKTQHHVSDFCFDETIVRVFPDMIERSVPNYAMTLLSIGFLAKEYVKSHSYCYDLGCSLGGASLAMGRSIPHNQYTLFAVDNSKAMIQRFSLLMNQETFAKNIQLQCADMLDITVQNASMVVLNYTLQFIALEQRLHVLKRIYAGMNTGSILVLSEKICAETQVENRRLIKLHEAFKKSCGYSDIEISQKREALEDVLLPETLAQHRQRLLQAGFSSVEEIIRGFNFVTFLACK